MRNLQLRKKYHLTERIVPQLLTACAWDNGANSVIFAYGPSEENPLLALGRWKPQQRAANSDGILESQTELITQFDAPCPLPDLSCDKILSLYFLPEKSTICLVLAGGDIILVRENPLDGEDKIEIVGSVEVGITAAKWSSDGELLALTTRANTLLLMTRELENSASVDFSEDDLKASKHVSVGWGKKETQFTGRGARALRDPTMPERVDEGIRSDFDRDETTVSWRGDGQFFAVNGRQASSRRVIRVYSRDGLLDGVSEPVDNLEAALSWRPSGNLIAGIQRHKDRTDVVFFERNGLRHGEFTLRFPTEENEQLAVKGRSSASIPTFGLEWNSDSTVLAVSLRNTVQLWTTGNYHWYLKQELRTTAPTPTPFISWDPESPLRFALIDEKDAHVNQYASIVTRSPTTLCETGTVAVIDGKTVKLTALRYANVPPPMAQVEYEIGASIMDVALFPDHKTELIAILDNFGNVTILRYDPRKHEAGLEMVARHALTHEVDGRHSIQFSNINTLMLFEYTAWTRKAWSVSLDRPDGDIQVYVTTEKDLDFDLLPGGEPASLYAVSAARKPISDLKELGSKPGISVNALDAPYDVDEIELIALPVPSQAQSEDSKLTSCPPTAFGITRNGWLYANRRVLTRDATSFAVTPAHLIYTTSKHMLKFVHLASEDQLEIPPDTPEIDERCRAVERGARIVTAIPETAAVILQMPRGNLETIFPRALVLAEIRRNIDRKEYKKAFMVCRKQRVDMNMIHDYKSEQLLSNVELFVDQIPKVEHIDLFLSQLRDEDVSVSMYRDTLLGTEADKVEAEHRAQQIVAGKVNRICDAFLPVLRARTAANMQNIITAHVCKTPPDIEAGLAEVSKFQHEGQAAGERAVEHICFLVDVNRLYDSALGLYDLGLALLIAQQSQKDPREYLPFLQRLHSLPPLRRNFSIDDHLSRYRKALASLWELGDFEEYKTYAGKHSLYEDALAACHYDESKYREVMSLHADYLLKQSRYVDAGLAYEYLEARSSAAEAYRLAHRWSESLSNACQAEYEPAQLEELATILADSLVESKDFHSAAIIHQDYLHDTDSAARLFCRGNWITDAIRLFSLHGKSSSIPAIVDVALTENMGNTTELLAECKGQLNAQVPRLRELRIKKAEEPLAFYEGTGDGADIPDNISLAATEASTTGGSLFTRYTGKTGTVGTNATRRTAKNKRREERRRARGKKGSVYEEEYLVNSIARLMERVNGVSDETQRLVVGLMSRGMRERARAVDAAMKELVGLCDDCRDEVFQLSAQGREQVRQGKAHTVAAVAAEVGGADADLGDDFAEVPPEPTAAPLIKQFNGLALLGR